jgi:hypothetical protein
MTVLRFTIIFIYLLCLSWISGCGGKQSTEPASQNPPPVITVQPVAEEIGKSSAVITWTTDVEATSVVKYDTVSESYSFSQSDVEKVTAHRIILSGLQSNTTYYFSVESEYLYGRVVSPEGQFTTLPTANELTSLGWIAYESGQYEEAIAWFQDALKEQNAHLDALTGIGWCHANGPNSSFDSSLVYFDEVIRYRDDYVDALAGRGFINLALRRYSGAVRDFEKVMIEDPNFIFQHNPEINIQDIQLGLAEIYFLRNQYEKVQDQLDALAPENGLNPFDPNTWTVDQVQYEQYTETLVAWIEKLRAMI